MRDFRELKVWWKGHQLTLEIYEATAGLPRQETHGLTAQLRRSCASIPTNVAEGRGRSDDAKLARFMQTAMGSASELEYRLLQSHRNLSGSTIEVERVLSTFMNKLRSS
ncbi:MAG: four helix bundle protein [Rubrobacter sp.]|nr:four helix bundle protein [Rubrobacter sp.]